MWSYRTLLSSLCRRALEDGGQTGKDLMELRDTTAPRIFLRSWVWAPRSLQPALHRRTREATVEPRLPAPLRSILTDERG